MMTKNRQHNLQLHYEELEGYLGSDQLIHWIEDRLSAESMYLCPKRTRLSSYVSVRPANYIGRKGIHMSFTMSRLVEDQLLHCLLRQMLSTKATFSSPSKRPQPHQNSLVTEP